MSTRIGTIEGLFRIKYDRSGLDQAAADLSKFGSRVTSTLNRDIGRITPLAAAAGIAAFGLAVKSIYDNVAQAQKAMAQLEAGVISTGGAAGRSAAELAELAGEYQRLTGVEDEVIMQGEAILLTFRRIGREAFPQALQATLDLSARGFGGLESTSKMSAAV